LLILLGSPASVPRNPMFSARLESATRAPVFGRGELPMTIGFARGLSGLRQGWPPLADRASNTPGQEVWQCQ
jgi:hypothetical protein